MSNCIKIPAVSLRLSPEHFDYSKLRLGKDLDGNAVVQTEEGIWFEPTDGLTTWRELRSFIRDHISIAAREVGGEIRGKIDKVRDEYDDFTKQFTMQLCFNSPTWEKYAY